LAIHTNTNATIIPNNISLGQCIPLYILDQPIIKIKNKQGHKVGLLITSANNIELIKDTCPEGMALFVIDVPIV